MSRALSIQDLVRETGLSDRTIKFYIADGLMDGPDSPGRYAVYSQKHLDRLKQIAELAAQGYKLAAIKLRFRADASAACYVRRALQEMNLPPTMAAESTVPVSEQVSEPVVISSEPDRVTESVEAWTHIRLTEGVELHCRQQLTDEIVAIVEQTIAFFRDRLDDTPERRS